MCEMKTYLVLCFKENKKSYHVKKISNGKLNPQCKLCTKTDNDVTKVSVIPGTNCIGYTQQKIYLHLRILVMNLYAHEQKNQSNLQSQYPPTKQKENNKYPYTPTNTSKCTD